MSCPFVVHLESMKRFTSHLVESLNQGKFAPACYVFSSMMSLRSHSVDHKFNSNLGPFFLCFGCVFKFCFLRLGYGGCKCTHINV